ncbi:MAG: hypothetical protein JWM38_1871 [Sphingomonas bacterium]|nr:hypothetical protein [Sphingomonas bacterium]MDB5718444.1 hypothetical protein [Sphingomonas bacterium]
MPILLALAGAMFFTWAGSRIALIVLGMRLRGSVLIGLAHLLSLLGIAFCVGLLKAHLETFRSDAVLIYVIPQLIWLMLDLASHPRLRSR